MEMLVVLALLAILASFVIRVGNSREAAALAVMQSDLRSLASAQEAHLAQFDTYANDLSELNYRPSENISMEVRGDRDGWSGQTTHLLRSDTQCALYIGDISPHPPATVEGLLSCSPEANNGGCSGG